jgi:hypothetical protein
VYQRRRFRSQGEQISAPQPQQPASPVPNLFSDLSPLSSSTQFGSSGNVSLTPEHVELPLAQLEILDPILENLLFAMDLSILVQIMTLPIFSHTLAFHLHIEHLLHLYKQCLFQGTRGVQNRIITGMQQ